MFDIATVDNLGAGSTGAEIEQLDASISTRWSQSRTRHRSTRIVFRPRAEPRSFKTVAKEMAMILIDSDACEATAGGWNIISAFGFAESVGVNLVKFTAGLGGTLRNYYGEEFTLELFAAGNMGA